MSLQFNFFNKLQASTGYKNSYTFGFDNDTSKQFSEAVYSNPFINTTRASRNSLGYSVDNPWFRDKYEDIINNPPTYDCYA